MGTFVQNESIDSLFKLITYFPENTDLFIKDIFDKDNKYIFIGKVKDFTVLKLESGEILLPDKFNIVQLIPEYNEIVICIEINKGAVIWNSMKLN